MSTNELNSKVAELRSLRTMADELQAEIEALTDSIKAELTARDTDTMIGPDWKITWKPYDTTRIDSKSLKADLPDIAARYSVITTARRFLLK